MATPFEQTLWAINALDDTDALNIFKAEVPPPVTPRAATTTSPERSGISLGALKRVGIECDGDESVAIGQALCRAFKRAQLLHRINPDLDATSAPSPVVPDTVFVEATGRVSARFTNPPDVPAAIQSIGKILSEILPTDSGPSLEAQIISKTLASPPQFETVDELSQSLAAYAPRDGTESIRALYERWEKRDVLKPAGTPSKAPPTTPLVWALVVAREKYAITASRLALAAAARWGNRPVAVLGALIATGVVIIGLSGWFLIIRSHPEAPTVALNIPRAPHTEIPSLPRIEIPQAPEEGQVALDTGANVPVPSPPPVNKKGARADAPGPAVLPRTVADAAPPAAQPPSSTAPPRAEPLAEPTEPDAPAASRADEAVTIAIDPQAPASGNDASARTDSITVRATAAPTIYGKKDVDVTPPTLILRRLLPLLRPSSPGVRLDALAVAIVVNERGTVESVKGLVAPQSMGELVLLTSALAAVKSWQFIPATKNGTPVKYRDIIPLRALTRAEP